MVTVSDVFGDSSQQQSFFLKKARTPKTPEGPTAENPIPKAQYKTQTLKPLTTINEQKWGKTYEE